MSNRSYTQEAKDTVLQTWNKFLAFLDKYDSDSWAAFGAFFAVVTFGMFLNFDAFRKIIGDIPSALISIFFEYSILAWKMTANRKRNDAKQNQISNTATWLSVVTAICMLVVNMFRIGGNEGFESTAYIIVGIAALIQVVSYLLFTQADPDKQIVRDHGQQKRELLRRQQNSNNVIDELQSDMQIVRFITNALKKVEFETRDLPNDVRENLIEAARVRLLAQFSAGEEVNKITAPLADLNKDGQIGKFKIQPTPPGMTDRVSQKMLDSVEIYGGVAKETIPYSDNATGASEEPLDEPQGF